MQAMQATGVWEHLRTLLPAPRKRARGGRGPAPKRPGDTVAFADICGGPGAFAQALLAQCRYYNLHMKGYGITLAGVEGLDWYPELLRRGFTPTYGIDGTGDVFKLANLEALASLTAASNLLLAVADGGFNVGFDVANYQETISTRITFGQWLAALKVLRPGGSFVLKLFDTFSPNSRALLFLSTFIYERVHIVKPKHSRVVNSERYLVCVNYRALPDGWMQFFDTYYEKGFPDNDHSALLIPTSLMQRDARFTDGVREMNDAIAARQKVALQMIIDAAASPPTAVEAVAPPPS
ncbi:cap-specific mRNA (nucleoside-2'-O-)-methyltransferase 1 [Strigomonas culicis]|nr:cap-specific mRNA (nucleoside-2'-O-)-methyltransferase 1 [Strigomonas culicis]|eukprot:EPY28263.1 cap-specific mRNA (nucleoside-2'-O-)-methyltransferase 1 [Strigomonas culicis]